MATALSPRLTLGACTLSLVSARYIAALLHGVKTPRLLEVEVAETKGVGGEGVLAEIPRTKAPPRPLALQRILAEECHAPGRAGFERWVLSMPPNPQSIT